MFIVIIIIVYCKYSETIQSVQPRYPALERRGLRRIVVILEKRIHDRKFRIHGKYPQMKRENMDMNSPGKYLIMIS